MTPLAVDADTHLVRQDLTVAEAAGHHGLAIIHREDCEDCEDQADHADHAIASHPANAATS
jgi:hypothetical protein